MFTTLEKRAHLKINTTLEKRYQNSNVTELNPPLVVNGKNLIKLKSIRSQSRTNVSSYDKIPKYEFPEKDISFISEILGRNIERNSWLLTAFKRKPKQKLESIGTEDNELNSTMNPDVTAPIILPKAREKHVNTNLRLIRTQSKKSSVLKGPKISADLYHKYISLLQISNGFELSTHKREYKYYIGPGNNDSLVNKIMKKKPGWSKVYTYHSAHFI